MGNIIGTSVLHYSILEKLGEGGMGKVYLANDTKLNRKVALKFLASQITSNETEIERFRNEARIAASLSHPNIAQIYAMEDAEEGSFISMQYVTGTDLKEYLEQKTLDNEERIKIAFNLCQGLSAAEQKGIIHRDIKASNIMINDEGQVKILDFGLARFESAAHITTTGETRGTALYMAPELILGQEATVRSDIWAYGVVLYQLFTKELPFDGVYEQAISYAILDEEPRPIEELNPNVPDNIKAIINRCLEKKPESRYSSFKEIKEDFGEERLSYAKNGSKLDRKEKTTSGSKRYYSYAAASIVLLVAILFSILNTDVMGGKNAGPKKLAIIPFKNIGEVAENRTLLDGILETMTSKLSQIDNYKDAFWVIPSSEVIMGNVNTPQEAYNQFRADLAVTGSLQDIGGAKRLTINLIDAENLRQIRSSVMDISGENILSLQSEMVIELIGMLNISADDNIKETLESGMTKNAQASSFYVNGQGYLIRYQEEENIDNAIILFSQAIEEDPGYALAYAALGEAYWRKFDQTKITSYVDSAEFYLDKATIINGELIPVKRIRALFQAGTGHYEDAIDIYQDILKQDPGNEEVYGAMGEAYQQLGEYEEAEKAFKKAISIKPNFWLEHKRLGKFYYDRGEYEKAIPLFEQVLKLAPNDVQALSNIGVAYFYVGKNEASITNLKKSFALQPNYTAASNLGTILRYSGDNEGALEYYLIATELNPNAYVGWGNLASHYGLMGYSEKERANYLKAIEVAEGLLKVNPNSITLNSALAGYNADVANNEDSRKYLKRSIELAPENPDVLYRVGSAYEKLGDRDNALTYIKGALDAGYKEDIILNDPELQKLIQDPRFQE